MFGFILILSYYYCYDYYYYTLIIIIILSHIGLRTNQLHVDADRQRFLEHCVLLVNQNGKDDAEHVSGGGGGGGGGDSGGGGGDRIVLVLM